MSAVAAPPRAKSFARLAVTPRPAGSTIGGRRVDYDEEAGQEAPVNIARNLGIIALASVLSAGMLSSASAADRSRPVVVTRPVAPAVVQPAPRLHPVLWCVGGVVVSVVIHNPIPAVVGCAITVVHVHNGYYY